MKEDRIKFLEAQVEALQRKNSMLETHNNLLFDYADNKMVEGCEEAKKVLNNILK